MLGGRWILKLAALFGMGALLASCEGVMTGTAVAVVALEPEADGGFKPVRLALTAEMSPVALNLQAEPADIVSEIGKWNRYRATLTRAGATIASGEFNINNTATPEGRGAPYVVQNMLIAHPGATGEYELTIRPVKSVDVTLAGVRVEVRRNVQMSAPATGSR